MIAHPDFSTSRSYFSSYSISGTDLVATLPFLAFGSTSIDSLFLASKSYSLSSASFWILSLLVCSTSSDVGP